MGHRIIPSEARRHTGGAYRYIPMDIVLRSDSAKHPTPSDVQHALIDLLGHAAAPDHVTGRAGMDIDPLERGAADSRHVRIQRISSGTPLLRPPDPPAPTS